MFLWEALDLTLSDSHCPTSPKQIYLLQQSSASSPINTLYLAQTSRFSGIIYHIHCLQRISSTQLFKLPLGIISVKMATVYNVHSYYISHIYFSEHPITSWSTSMGHTLLIRKMVAKLQINTWKPKGKAHTNMSIAAGKDQRKVKQPSQTYHIWWCRRT